MGPRDPISYDVKTAIWDIQDALEEVDKSNLSVYAKSMIVSDAIIRIVHIIAEEITVPTRANGRRDQKASYRQMRRYFDLDDRMFQQLETLRHGNGNHSQGALAHKFHKLKPERILEQLPILLSSLKNRR